MKPIKYFMLLCVVLLASFTYGNQILGVSPSASEISKAMLNSPNHSFSMSVTVAASNAATSIKAAADYVCTGTNDQEVIQAAIDAVGNSGGVVQLSGGRFTLSKNSQSPAYKREANVTFTKSADSGTYATLTVADGTAYNVFDFLRIYGGSRNAYAANIAASSGAWDAEDVPYATGSVVTYDGKYWKSDRETSSEPSTVSHWAILPVTMEDNFQQTYAQVTKITGNVLTVAALITTDNYDNVTIDRLQWAIKLSKNENTRSPYLRGSSIWTTQLRMASNADSICIYTANSTSQAAAGTTSIDSGFGHFEIDGNYSNQTAERVGLCPGVVITNQDIHVQDVAIWYCAGPGLITTQGWGNHWVAGWIEYNWGPCIWQTTSAPDMLFDRVKCLALTSTHTAAPAGAQKEFATPSAIIAENTMLYHNGILGASLTGSPTVQLRGRANRSRFSENRISASTNDAAFWIAPYTQGNIGQCQIVNNRFSIGAGNAILSGMRESLGNTVVALNGWLVEGNTNESSTATDYHQAFFLTDDYNSMTGVIANNPFVSPFEQKCTAWIYNNSGGNLTLGRLVRLTVGTSRMEAVYASNLDTTITTDYGLMHGTYATGGSARVTRHGKAMWSYNNAGGNVAIGDPLTVGDANGQGQKAAAGEWVFAIAQQTSTSATYSVRNVYLLERPYQIPAP